jgi:hypothetical protein
MGIRRHFLMILVCLGLGLPVMGWLTLEAAGQPEIPSHELTDPGAGYETESAGVEYPYTFGPIITDTAIPVPQGQFQIQPIFGLGFVINNYTHNWRRVSAGGNYQSYSMEWKFTYGLVNNLEVYMIIPYIHNWASNVNNPGPKGETSASFGGLGDVNFNLKYRVVSETDLMPTISAFLSNDFPTGHYKNLNPGKLNLDNIGGGTYLITAGFNISKYLKPLIIYGNFYYGMQPAYNSDTGRKYPRDAVTVNLAAELPITKKWVALLEMVSSWDGGRLFGHRANEVPQASLGLIPGIEYMATDRFAMALGVRWNCLGKNVKDLTENLTVTPLLSMTYIF